MRLPSKQYEWAEPYRLAMLETDPEQLLTRVVAAKSAINERVSQLSNSLDDHKAERETINQALKMLELLLQQAGTGEGDSKDHLYSS